MNVDAFLAGELTEVVSSHHRAAVYDAAGQKLTLIFRDGGAYEYYGVTLDMARSYAAAASKGTWVWDNLRVRGSKTAHKVAWAKLY